GVHGGAPAPAGIDSPAGQRSAGSHPHDPADPRGRRRRMSDSETLRGGAMWSRRMRRGQTLRLTDTTGRAAVAALFYNADAPLERYNMPDTLKAQYTAFLTAGRVLYSDMGRILASIVEDTCGWHDTISGCGNADTNRARFGEGRYQELR